MAKPPRAMGTSTPSSPCSIPTSWSARTRAAGPWSRYGAENVARSARAFSQLGLVVRPALINGAAGWIALLDRDVYAIAALTVRRGRIKAMDSLLDPARLARLDLTAFDSRP